MITEELRQHVAKLAANHTGCFVPIEYEDEDALAHHCEHYGCSTVEEYEATTAWESYFDLHKDAYGHKPRWTKWSDHTAEEWHELIAQLPL